MRRVVEFDSFANMKTLAIVALGLALAIPAHASKEGILALSSFRMESAGIGSSGKIVVEGQQNEKSQLVTLKISAFGKEYVVPKEKLTKLADLLSNGVRLSVEQGYRVLGGRTIYVQLQMGFTSFTKKEALITVFEDGKIEISDGSVKKSG